MMKKLVKTCALASGVLMAATGAHAEISDGVVRIGVMNDMSSVYSASSGQGSVVAAELAVQDYLEQSGSKLEVEILSADHQNKPDVGLTIARRWFDADGVDMISDVPTSSIALGVNTLAREKDKAFITTGAGTPDLTGQACSPNTVQWLYDTWQLAHSIGRATVENGGDSWFFITADYKFGQDLMKDTAAVVEEVGGKVLGSARVPLGTTDFSSFILQAQASGAKVIGLANAAGDTTNSIKQAAEFGITEAGQQLAAMLVFLPDIHGMGLDAAQGLLLTETFYWDMNDETRAWTQRFVAANDGKYPSANHAGVYASVLHYLKAVDAAGSDAGRTVVAKMKELPTDDPLFGPGQIRVDGRKLHPVYLFKVKSPEASRYPWDYYDLVATIPAEDAFRPLEQGGCDLVE